MSIRKALALTLLIPICLSPAMAAGKGRATYGLAIPARHVPVRLAFDMGALRNTTIISYDETSDPAAPLLHLWNSSTRQWGKISLAEYQSGAVFTRAPRDIFVIGTDKSYTSTLIETSPMKSKTILVPSISIVPLLTALDAAMDFSATEWRWLADRYDLTIKDRNEDRRRYGRYGKPGEKKPVRQPQPEEEAIIPDTVEPDAPAEDPADKPTEETVPAQEPEAAAALVTPDMKAIATQPALEQTGSLDAAPLDAEVPAAPKPEDK